MVGDTVDILDALTIRDVVVGEMVDMIIVAMLVNVDAVITTEEMESDMVETKNNQYCLKEATLDKINIFLFTFVTL